MYDRIVCILCLCTCHIVSFSLIRSTLDFSEMNTKYQIIRRSDVLNALDLHHVIEMSISTNHMLKIWVINLSIPPKISIYPHWAIFSHAVHIDTYRLWYIYLVICGRCSSGEYCINPFSAGTDFRRPNLPSKVVRF